MLEGPHEESHEIGRSLGLDPADLAILHSVALLKARPRSQIDHALWLHEHWQEILPLTQNDLEAALASLLARDLLQIVGDLARQRIACLLADPDVLSITSGMGGVPPLGAVEFTEAGGEFYGRISEPLHRWLPGQFAYVEIERDRQHGRCTVRAYATDPTLAEREFDRYIEGAKALEHVGPLAVGLWRDHWWRTPKLGWRLEAVFDERRV